MKSRYFHFLRPLGVWEVFWWVVLGLWTIGLLRPEPIQLRKEWIPDGAGWFLAKGTHFFMYLLLALFRLALTKQGPVCWLFLGLLLVHGGVTEFFQQWVALRHGSILDVLVDGSGVFSGWFCFLLWHKGWLKFLPSPLHPEQEQSPGKE